MQDVQTEGHVWSTDPLNLKRQNLNIKTEAAIYITTSTTNAKANPSIYISKITGRHRWGTSQSAARPLCTNTHALIYLPTRRGSLLNVNCLHNFNTKLQIQKQMWMLVHVNNFTTFGHRGTGCNAAYSANGCRIAGHRSVRNMWLPALWSGHAGALPQVSVHPDMTLDVARIIIYVLATSKVISRRVLTSDSTHSWQVYSAGLLGNQ